MSFLSMFHSGTRSYVEAVSVKRQPSTRATRLCTFRPAILGFIVPTATLLMTETIPPRGLG